MPVNPCTAPTRHGRITHQPEAYDRRTQRFRALHKWECLTVQGEELRDVVPYLCGARPHTELLPTRRKFTCPLQTFKLTRSPGVPFIWRMTFLQGVEAHESFRASRIVWEDGLGRNPHTRSSSVAPRPKHRTCSPNTIADHHQGQETETNLQQKHYGARIAAAHTSTTLRDTCGKHREDRRRSKHASKQP